MTYEKRITEIEKTLTEIRSEIQTLRTRNQVLEETIKALYEFNAGKLIGHKNRSGIGTTNKGS